MLSLMLLRGQIISGLNEDLDSVKSDCYYNKKSRTFKKTFGTVSSERWKPTHKFINDCEFEIGKVYPMGLSLDKQLC